MHALHDAPAGSHPIATVLHQLASLFTSARCAGAGGGRYNLYNFPDAHFFIFLRGGDGFGKFQHRIRGIPGVTGGTALIYPCVLHLRLHGSLMCAQAGTRGLLRVHCV